MSLQPYSMALQHALELDDFLQEANITTTDLFAVLGHQKYRKPLMSGIKTIVNNYKEQGRDPPPIDVTPVGKPKKSRPSASVPRIPQLSQTPPLPETHEEHGRQAFRIDITPSSSSSLVAAVPTSPDIEMDDVPIPTIVVDDYEEQVRTPPISTVHTRPQPSMHTAAHPEPRSRTPEALMQFVPGTRIQIRHLTAPHAWTYLRNHEAIAGGMSFVARIFRHLVTKWNDKVIELNFGNGDTAVMLISSRAPDALYNDIEARYPAGTFIYVQNVSETVVAGTYFLRFSKDSSIQRLHHVTLESMAAVNAQCNRRQMTVYDEVVEAFRGPQSSFVAELERHRRQGHPTSRS
ncbi:hypothetical protein sr10581 [Sporisorium reilianum SRZ2]|uniref:Uncharacterized protein n=1 Tax=Sporisorium reilianum (strain SRZ2) TaxID=999809 RepID=E6ZXZ0_SPORE|nr:hypothetical protein sr10581 [Sporisorium reilianum SRZ2]